jgi:protein SCO1/2
MLGFALGLALWSGGPQRLQATSPDRERPAQELIEPSIYALDPPLVDQDGRTVALADFRGRPLVATMAYTTCTSVCPTIVPAMKATERKLPASLRDRVTFVMFSLDPGRDTPSALARFAELHDLDRKRWRLVAATEDDVRLLSAALGIKYAREPDGTVAHSSVILAISPDGIVRHRQVGFARSSEGLVDALREDRR